MPNYEIRRSGQVICSSSIPNCGYSKDILRDMEHNGMHLYHDGKREKAASGRSRTESGKGK